MPGMARTAAKISAMATEIIPAALSSSVVAAKPLICNTQDGPSQQQFVTSTSAQPPDASIADTNPLVEPHAAPIERLSSKRAHTSFDTADVALPQDKLVKLDAPKAVRQQLASIFAPVNSLKGKERAVALVDTPGKFRFVWQKSDPSHLLHGTWGSPLSRTSIACFDIDGTLIETKSMAKFPRDEKDWQWWCQKDKVQARLKEYYDAGYGVAFVSNQNYGPHTKSHQRFKAKLPLIAASLGNIPFRVFAAIDKDQYRKPNIGIWLLMEKLAMADGIELDKQSSFYVGDAAGRSAYPRCPNKKPNTAADHSNCDKEWAANAGISFFTPEEFFWERKDDFAGPKQNAESLAASSTCNIIADADPMKPA